MKRKEVIAAGLRSGKVIRRNGETVVITRMGAAGTMRQVIRQKSGKVMREGKYGRKTVAIKEGVLRLLDREKLRSETSGMVKYHTDSQTGEVIARRLTLKEAWDMLDE